MKVFSLLAALVVVALSAPSLTSAQNVLIATADAADNSSEPIFLPGVATPSGLDSRDGSAGGDNEEAEGSPLLTVKAPDMGSGSMDKMMTKPAPTGKNSSTPAPTKSAAAVSLVGVGVALAASALSAVLL